MPAKQRGTVDKKRGSWRARWSDESGRPREKRGFRTKSEGRDWLDRELDKVHKLRRGERVIDPNEFPTLSGLADEFLEQHNAEANTIRTLRDRLRYAVKGPKLDGKGGFGELRIDRLTMKEIAAWRKQLPAGSAWHIHKALRQVLTYAVAAYGLKSNPAREVANPEPKRTEIPAFASPVELDAVAEELEPAYAAIPVLASETGLRPEEWIALERRDLEIDRKAGVGLVHVRRVYTDGQVKPYGKNHRSLRTVALTPRAVAAIEAMPPRIDTPLLFPGTRGGYLDLHAWRARHWTPAVKAAGLAVDEAGRKLKRTPYSLRHTYAAWSIATGKIELFTLAKRMGTSVEQIDKTYGHLLPGSIELERDALAGWIAEQEAQAKKAAER
jgi:integrase